MARILLVEDDDSVRSLAARALRRDGHEVDEAVSGTQGLDMIRVAAYALVVSDVRMPEMDGLTMTRAAMAICPSLRVLLATGFAGQQEQATDLTGVVVGVLYKPYSLAELRASVRRAVAGVPVATAPPLMAQRS